MSTYFQGLNYSLANEDTWVEHDLAPANAQSFFAVCGSGSRVIPLLAKNPKELHIVDLSETQLKLFRLRHAAIKQLSYEEYLFLLGYTKKSPTKARPELLKKLNLPAEDQKEWNDHVDIWKDQGFIYLGKWERHFMMLGKAFQRLTFANLKPVFDARNFEEQKKVIHHWKSKLFRLYTQIVMNEWVANKLLYKGHFAGGKGKNTMEVSAAEFVFREFDDLYQNTWVRSNYFLNMIFLNSVSTAESYPAECNREVFEAVKKADTQIFYYKENLLKLLNDRPHDFYSLSDTFSYMQDAEVQDFLKALPSSIKSGTQMVIRTFMRKPSFSIVAPWKTDSEENKTLAKKDCTRMYEFSLLRKM